MDAISQKDIMSLFEDGKSAILYLYTPLCGTCQLAGKMLTIVEKMHPTQTFVKADLNYAREFAEMFKIESVPCLLIVKNGELIQKLYAFQSVPYLHSIISQYD